MLLAGGIDTALALVGYSDTWTSSNISRAPDLLMPGIQWESDDTVLAFKWYENSVSFFESRIDDAAPEATSGLLVMSPR